MLKSRSSEVEMDEDIFNNEKKNISYKIITNPI